MSLAVDLTSLTPRCTDHALEHLHKALADPPDADGIWLPHPDPWIADAVEAVTARGRERLRRILEALMSAARQAASLGKSFRPDAAEVAATFAALGGKPPHAYNVGDWLALIDWLVLKYLPREFAISEAEYMAVRGLFAGRIQAMTPGGRPPSDLDTILSMSVDGALRRIPVTPLQRAMLDVATARSTLAITNVGEATRSRIQRLLLDHLEKTIARDPAATVSRLEQKLFDEFSILNRDWRRIAITETGNATAEAVIASAKPGQRVKRFEAYEGACPFCAKINDLVFTVVDAAKPDKDGWKEVWPGKSNVGRSASPRKREGDELVPREPEELWWPASGLQHPNAVFAGSTFRSYGDLEEMVSADYCGPAIKILAGGYRTTIGPNHPMLTRRGMVRAKALREGDELVRDLLHDAALSALGDSDLEKMKVVEDVFQAVGAIRPHAFIAASGNDLHGDGMHCKGQIDVVRTKGVLLPKFDSLGLENFRENGFMGADAAATLETSFRSRGSPLDRTPTAASGGVCCGLPRFAFARIEHLSIGHFSGRAFDASVTTSLYCSDGFVVSNCRGGWTLLLDAPADASVRADVERILSGGGIAIPWAG